MIFFLASLSKETYNVVSKVFKTYAEGKLNDQTIPRSKKGIKLLPDLKGSTFKAFRGLDVSTIHQILTDVMNNELSIKEATVQCTDINTLQKVQQGFMHVMNVGSWSETNETYPQHTTPEKLEPFKHLDFSGPQVPQQFLQFCQQIKTTESSEASTEDYDDVFMLKYSTVGIIWKHDITNVTVESFDATFKNVGVDKCMGFSLILFDYTLPCEMNIDQVYMYIKYVLYAKFIN